MASIFLKPNHPPHYIEATEAYRIAPDTDSPIKLRIASGGAGQSGLIRTFAEGFIKHHVKTTGAAPFAIAWMASDTTVSFNSLALKAVDMSITYHPVAEKTAIQQGIAERREYIWQDHWMLVGRSQIPFLSFNIEMRIKLT
jgi:ABC-type tungstate transport system permease subunit